MEHQCPKVKAAVRKYFPVRPEGNGGSVFLAGAGTQDMDLVQGNATGIALHIGISVLVHLHFQTAREGIDNRGPNTVEASRYFIAAVIEFASCVEDGEHHLYG